MLVNNFLISLGHDMKDCDLRCRPDDVRRQRTPKAKAIDLPEADGAPQFKLKHLFCTETEEIALTTIPPCISFFNLVVISHFI